MSEKRGPGRIFVLSVCLIWIPLLAFLAKLAYIESLTGDPETGRLYFTDIVYEDDDGNVTSLLGVITTFSYTFLLLSSFCSGALAYIQGGCKRGRDAVAFWGVCSVLLFLAGLDERFLWHETIGFRLQIEDVWIVSVYPLLLLLAAWWGRQEAFRFRRNAWLAVPIVLGAVASLYIDVFRPGPRPYRLLAEDGSKIIATSCVFLLCFKCFLDELDQLSSRSGSSDSAVN
jgi:hypothetical protein